MILCRREGSLCRMKQLIRAEQPINIKVRYDLAFSATALQTVLIKNWTGSRTLVYILVALHRCRLLAWTYEDVG